MSTPDDINRREFLTKCVQGGLGALVGCGLGSAAGLLSGAQPAEAAIGNVSRHPAQYWEKRSGNTVRCQLCPRYCVLAPGQRGECGVRMNYGGKLVSLVYGKPVAVHGDPIEKAPFFHFLPSIETLAVGTAGCNLHCKYCQNWEFTQALPERTDKDVEEK